MGIGSILNVALNATGLETESGSSTSGFQFRDEDIDRIAVALQSRMRAPYGIKVFDFVLGILFAVVVAAVFFNKLKTRLVQRRNEREIVEVLKNLDDDSVKRLIGDANLPSWVNFPDFERVEWINTVFSQLWPFINSAVSQQFREMLAPLLHQNKPSWISSLKLFRFDLGDTAPQANGVKVYDHADQHGEITIDIDFSWVGNQDVQLTIKPIPKHLGPLSPAGQLLSSIIHLRAGIERITINGKLRMMWSPLLGELPIVAGMQAALVEMPKFSFDVTIYGGNASLVPGLEQWLTQFMKDTVFRPYILPDRYTHSFTDGAELEDLRPKGMLFLRVIEAKHVPKMDVFSQSDPYVRLSVRHAIQMRTGIKENNANPKWNEDFKFLIHHFESQVLTCVLMDFDNFNPDDEIGRCTLPIRDLKPEETKDFWLEVNLHTDSESAAEKTSAGVVDKIVSAERIVAAQTEKVWKRLPGVKQKGRTCQLHIQTTLYMLDSHDLEEAVRQDEAAGQRQPQRKQEARRRRPEDGKDGQYRSRASSSDVQGDDGVPTARGTPHTTHITDVRKHNKLKGDGERAAEDVSVSGRDDGGIQDKHSTSGKRALDGVPENGSRGREEEDELRREPNESRRGDDHMPQQNGAEDSQMAEARGDKTEHSKSGGPSHRDIRKEALDALKGGILYVKPRKGEALKRKPWYKSFFLHSHAQLEISICGYHKSTASASGNHPIFSETLEFLLGGQDIQNAKEKRLKIEVWDHRLHINYFRGECFLVLNDIITSRCIKNTLRLSGVPHGELTLEVYWIAALDAARRTHKAPQTGAAERQ